jgi:hypothetical protein
MNDEGEGFNKWGTKTHIQNLKALTKNSFTAKANPNRAFPFPLPITHHFSKSAYVHFNLI